MENDENRRETQPYTYTHTTSSIWNFSTSEKLAEGREKKSDDETVHLRDEMPQ